MEEKLLTVKVIGNGICEGYDCEGSLSDLNKRYKGKNQIVVERFRSFIVVSNTKPYDEDYWRHIKVGKYLFEVLGPCVRCIQTTIDPKTTEKHPNVELLRELRKYRLTKGRIEKQYGISPVFGVQVSVKDGYTIKTGDDVLINYKKIQH